MLIPVEYRVFYQVVLVSVILPVLLADSHTGTIGRRKNGANIAFVWPRAIDLS